MVETAYPFDTGPGANVLETEWQRMARLWLSTGVAVSSKGGRPGHLAVSANGGAMQVTVAAGTAWVEGFLYDSDAAKTLDIGAADATNPRIDTVVLRLDRTTNGATTTVLQGTPAASPAAPALTQTDVLWELPLADVRVNAAVGVINAGDVTDRRLFAQGARGPLTLYADTNDGPSLTLQAKVGNTSNLLEARTEDGVLQLRIAPGGALRVGEGASAARILVGPGDGGGMVSAVTNSPSAPGVVILLSPGQSAHAFDIRGSDGASLSRFDNVGRLHANGVTTNSGLNIAGGDLDMPAAFSAKLGGAAFLGATLQIYARTTDNSALKLRTLDNQTADPFDIQNDIGQNILRTEVRANGDQGVHLRLVNPLAATNANYASVLSPSLLFQSNTWDSAAGNVSQFGAIYLAHEATNVTAPTSAVIIQASTDGSLVDLAAFGPNNGLTIYGSRGIKTGGQIQQRYMVLDYRGDGVANVYCQDYPADANQVSWTTAPEGETYRTLRAGGFVTASKGETKTDVQAVDLQAGAVSQGERVRLLKATTTRPLNDRLRELVPVSYKRRRPEGDPGDDPTTHADPTLYSFVAEEAARVVPEVVAFDAKGAPSGIDVGAVAVLTLAAVQSLMDRVARLENPPAPQPTP